MKYEGTFGELVVDECEGEDGVPNDWWFASLVVNGYGDTEQEALDALLLGYLSILDTDGRAHAVRFAQALCGAIEAGRCHE